MKSKEWKHILWVFMVIFLTMTPITFASSGDSEPILDLDLIAPLSVEIQTEERIVIVYDEPAENNIEKLELSGAQISAGETLSPSVDIVVPAENQSMDKLIEEISQKDNVMTVSQDALLYTDTNDLPNDTFFVNRATWWYSMIQADMTWNRVVKDDPVKVAVIDSGCETTHPDLLGRVAAVNDQYAKIKNTKAENDLAGHGTEVSGTIAATTNNGIGVAGTVGLGNVQILPYRCGGSYAGDTSISASAVAAALLDVVNNQEDARIINLSVGVKDNGTTNNTNAINILREPIAKAVAADKIIVASAGNDGSKTMYSYPASFDGVISVGAIDSDGNIASFSNQNDKIDVVAPGMGIPTTALNESYGLYSGTSFSAPIVSGACALLLSENQTLPAEKVEEILESTAKDLGEEGYDNAYGYGVVQINTALQKIVKEEYSLGDINGDWHINTSDALLALRHSVKEIELTDQEFTRGDVTKDNQINATDALQILRFSVKEISGF